MNQPKKQPAVVAAAPRTPYTATRDGKDRSVNGTGTDGFTQALDRRVTEGFNLVHGRLDVIQEDVRENRRDIKGLRQELWEGFREAAGDRARLATRKDLDGLRAATSERITAVEASQHQFRAEMHARFAALEESQNQFRAEVSARFAALEESQNQFRAEVSARFAALEESQNQFRAEVSARFAALEESQNQFRAEVSARFAALEESNRKVITILSKTQERSEATAWTHRQVLVAVVAGMTLLVAGALLQPLLERVAAALFGG